MESTKLETLNHSNCSELFASDIDYKKSRFRLTAIMNTHTIKFASIRDTRLSPFSTGAVNEVLQAHTLVPSSPLRLKPILKRSSSPHEQHALQAFYRFHLVVSNARSPTSPNGVPEFEDLVLDDDEAAAYLRASEKSAVESGFVSPSFNAILHFCDCVENALVADPSRRIALRVPPDYAAVSAAVFLVGTYMLLRVGIEPSEIEERVVPFLSTFQAAKCVPEGSTDKSGAHCSASSCWRGLWKALKLGWLAAQAPGITDPFRADVQQLVPGKLVVFRGPRALPEGEPWRDVVSGDGRPVGRDFSPAHMAGELRPMGVAAVVRLNAAEYPADAFPAEGLAFADLPVPEGGCPSPAVVAKFLRLLDAVPGAVAVHGGASLGRAGTLAALYAMRRHDFTACEAAGWLRTVRPGSITSSQLEYLAGREAVLRRGTAAASDEVGNASPLTQVALMLGRGGSLPRLTPCPSQNLLAPASGGHSPIDRSVRAAQAVAEVMAEVDARMLALETCPDSRRPGRITRRISATAGMPSSVSCGSFSALGGPSESMGGLGSLSLDCSRRRRSMFSSRSFNSDSSGLASTISQAHPSESCGVDGKPETAPPSLRFCADLLPLPSTYKH